MRSCQKDYFKNRDHSTLKLAKIKESEVDKKIDLYLKTGSLEEPKKIDEPTLF